jgi:FSR family fosmidomycin resistance protein-like MFS transporter
MATADAAPIAREIRAIGLIGFGHFLSHFYFFGMVPLFVGIRAEFDISLLEIGGILTAWNIASGILQTPMGGQQRIPSRRLRHPDRIGG